MLIQIITQPDPPGPCITRGSGGSDPLMVEYRIFPDPPLHPSQDISFVGEGLKKVY